MDYLPQSTLVTIRYTDTDANCFGIVGFSNRFIARFQFFTGQATDDGHTMDRQNQFHNPALHILKQYVMSRQAVS